MAITQETVPVTDELVVRAQGYGKKVLISHKSHFRGNRHHLTARKDKDGRWYVRRGFGGNNRYYLKECEVMSKDGRPLYHAFTLD
jgi:hypothetical protein